MPLQVPQLDDRTAAALFAEARTLIPRYAPEWTDHNESDPGITLVQLFAWMTANYSTILGRSSPQFARFMPVYAGGCSRERLQAARAFFQEHPGPGVEQTLAQTAAQVEDCVGLREREGVAVREYLEQAQAAR